MKPRHAIRTIIVVALFLTVMAFSGCASSRYHYRYDNNYYDGGNDRQAHRYGFQSGYNDGYRKGEHEGRENDPGDINVNALRQATHGYRSWMGPVESFQDGYRDGYRDGFRKGYEATNRRWNRDNDYYRY